MALRAAISGGMAASIILLFIANVGYRRAFEASTVWRHVSANALCLNIVTSAAGIAAGGDAAIKRQRARHRSPEIARRIGDQWFWHAIGARGDGDGARA